MSPVVALLAGVLVGSLFLAGAAVGAAVLRLIGRLTGGAWSEAAGLQRLASLGPAPVLCAVAARAALAPWIVSPPGPAAAWRGAALLDVRLVLSAAAWIWIGWLARRRPSPTMSGLALLVFGLSVSLAAFDLILSLQPGWVSSAEGMALAVRMLGCALAAALLTTPFGVDRSDAGVERDLQGLLAATLLATLYLNLMGYLIPWYGDLPDKTGWIRLRTGPGWSGLIVCALAAGAGAPLVLLALRARLGAGAGRLAAGLALAGFLGQTVWLLAPPLGPLAALAGAAIALAGLVTAVWRSPSRGEAAHAS